MFGDQLVKIDAEVRKQRTDYWYCMCKIWWMAESDQEVPRNDSPTNLDPLITYSHCHLIFLPHSTERVAPSQTGRQTLIV